ncbi:MAG: M14 family zinc carboxypeptidase [Rhodospirillaceae bacterium]
MRNLKAASLSVLFGILASASSVAEDLDYYLPSGVAYDPAIPTPSSVLGYEVGAYVSNPGNVTAYIQAVAAASDRITLEVIGRTHERRPIHMLTISSPENLARIDDIHAKHLALSEPSSSQTVEDDMPAITWLGFGVHGDEISSMEAGLLTVYHLAAAQDPATVAHLENTVVLLVPVLNPDGYNRASTSLNTYRGEAPVANLQHAEHNGTWPRGRTNHYWFDLNRQWMARTQPEAQAWGAQFQKWKPHLLADFHEMLIDSTYFFSPGIAEQRNPYIPERATELTRIIGTYAQEYLDSAQELYYSEEFFDDYNPAMGSNYPLLLGSVAFLFENRGFEGLLAETPTGDITLGSRVKRHLNISLSMVRAASDLRETLLDYRYQFGAMTREAAASDRVKGYVFTAHGDDARMFHFLDMLDRLDIDVFRLARSVRDDGVTFQTANSYIVPTNQPTYRLIRNLFETRTDFGDVVFYDATTWTKPLAFGLTYADLTAFGTDLLSDKIDPAFPVKDAPDRAAYAYVFSWEGYYAPRAVARLLKKEGHARVALQPFTAMTTQGAVDFEPGAIIVPVGDGQPLSAEALHSVMTTIGKEDGIQVYAAITGRTERGIDFGGNYAQPLVMPKVLMPIGESVRFYDAGELWHLMDYRMDIPVLMRDAGVLRSTDWSRVTHLVLPDGSYDQWSDDQVRQIDAWIKQGGTLVAIKRAALWAVKNKLMDVDIIDDFAIVGFGAPTPANDEDTAAPLPERQDYAVKENVEQAQRIRGTIFETDVDITHPIGFGYTSRLQPSFRENRIILGRSKNPFGTVAQYTDAPLMSGFASAENIEKVAGAGAVLAERRGQGAVVLLSDNPNFRAWWFGPNKMFLNSLFFSTAIKAEFSRFGEEAEE